jgi:hypothetical protein
MIKSFESPLSGAEKIKPHSLSNGLPIPYRNPIASIHQGPNFFQQLNGAITASQPCVSADSFDCLSYSAALADIEASSANHSARD